jgi:hypothetical protein
VLYAARAIPEEAAPRPRAALVLALLGVGSWTSMWFGFPFSIEIGTRLNPALGGLVILLLLAILTRNYLRAGPAGRRQAKWVLLGIYAGTLPVLGAVAAAAIDPELVWLWNWSLSALVLIGLDLRGDHALEPASTSTARSAPLPPTRCFSRYRRGGDGAPRLRGVAARTARGVVGQLALGVGRRSSR